MIEVKTNRIGSDWWLELGISLHKTRFLDTNWLIVIGFFYAYT
jgi:hypothetical protein